MENDLMMDVKVCSPFLIFFSFISDSEEQVWIWNVEGDRLFMETDEDIRFRVIQEIFHDNLSPKHGQSEPIHINNSNPSSSSEPRQEVTKLAPYILLVSQTFL
jgi:DNA-directed RNA polymerase subunit E'/Rpb7